MSISHTTSPNITGSSGERSRHDTANTTSDSAPRTPVVEQRERYSPVLHGAAEEPAPLPRARGADFASIHTSAYTLAMSKPIPNRTIPAFVRSVDASFPHTSVAPPPDALPNSRWTSYMRASGAPRRHLTPEQRAAADALWSAYDDESKHPQPEDGADNESLLSDQRKRERRERYLKRLQRQLMLSPFAPLVFRTFIIVTSIIALALASDVYGNNRGCKDDSTHTLAIIVNTVAIPYTLYITWDEFFSQPIGLRKPRSKLRLLVLDLVFIIFDSANLSLAFDAGTNTEEEFRAPDPKCAEQWGLVVVLLVALIAWVSTFMLSLFRLIYRMEGGNMF